MHAVVERLVRSSIGTHAANDCNAGAQDSGAHEDADHSAADAAHLLHRLPPLGVRGNIGGMVCSTGTTLLACQQLPST